MPQRLRDVGIERAGLQLLAADAMTQARLLRNDPCPIAERDARPCDQPTLACAWPVSASFLG